MLNKNYTEMKLRAEQGDVNAMYDLGLFFYDADNADYKQAFFWFQESAKQENVLSQFQLSTMYEFGKGVEKNVDKAVYWLNKAAENNLASAQNNSGSLYCKDMHVERDDELAIYCSPKKTNQGHKYGLFNLAFMYGTGFGVDLDEARAAYLYYTAREKEYKDARVLELINAGYSLVYHKVESHRDAEAQVLLGLIYMTGYGVKKDEGLAHFYFSRAASQYYPGAGDLRHLDSLDGYGDLPDRLRKFYSAEGIDVINRVGDN